MDISLLGKLAVIGNKIKSQAGKIRTATDREQGRPALLHMSNNYFSDFQLQLFLSQVKRIIR